MIPSYPRIVLVMSSEKQFRELCESYSKFCTRVKLS